MKAAAPEATCSFTKPYSIEVPPGLRDSPALAAGPFFTIPGPLLEGLLAVEEGIHDPKFIDMERQLSATSGDHSARIGFLGNMPIDFGLLRPGPSFKSHENLSALAQSWGKTEEEVCELFDTGEARLKEIHTVARGYLGWLLTNLRFRAEYSEMFAEDQNPFASMAIATPECRVSDVSPFEQLVASLGEADSFRARDAFLGRWRLESMRASFLPMPICSTYPQIDQRPRREVVEGGQSFFIPDTFSVPTRDQLRHIIEDAVRGASSADHLEEWHGIVALGNTAKRQIERFGRVFEVQHYCQIIQSRYAKLLPGNRKKIVEVLAQFLKVQTYSIEQDIELITARLKKTPL